MAIFAAIDGVPSLVNNCRKATWENTDMPYAEGRIIHDADSHLMELGDCLDPYLTAPLRARLHGNAEFAGRRNDKLARNEEAIAKHADPAFRAGVGDAIMLRKNQEAHGSFIAADRPEEVSRLVKAYGMVANSSAMSFAFIPLMYRA